MSSVTQFLIERASEPKLQDPAPPAAALDQAFQCAARAPDHALLRPWRYLVVQGDDRERLGELFATTCSDDATEAEREKARRSPLRAPVVIVGIASPRHHPKVPEVEQVMTAAIGLSFVGLSLRDAGFGAMWRTGAVAYHPVVHEGLGLAEHESIVGFLYAGSVAQQKPAVPRPEPREFVARWHQPGATSGWE
ncbi:MAG: nitroreductase [Marinobacter sp. 34-60-7]|nr:MAG: nitroreductase [Marinobacter sp. 34-60-7]